MAASWNEMVRSYGEFLARYLECGDDRVVAEACRDLVRGWELATPGAARMAEIHLDALRRAACADVDRGSTTWTTVERSERFLIRVLASLDLLRDAPSDLSHRDRLTGLPNRHELLDALAGEAARSRRHARPLSIATVTVTGLDEPASGSPDIVMCRIAQALTRAVRREDTIYRSGPREFVVLMPDTPVAGALIAARRLAEAMDAAIAAATDADTRSIDARIGTATMPTDASDAPDMVELAGRRAVRALGDRSRVWASPAAAAP